MLLCGGIACLALAGTRHRALLSMRYAGRTQPGPNPEQLPPLVAFTTVALGGFRGIAADLLWIRASRLQDQGRYFELAQLADWITKLEPHFAAVWSFHAWNMAYNISVMFPAPEDRWRWIQNGIRLLRDQGLAYNPNSPAMYHELGWLFQHKIGGTSDRAGPYYRHRWAAEMGAIFDGPTPPYSDGPESHALSQLVHEYKMDPTRMRELDKTYGPLDWRIPETHALYWACQGRLRATSDEALPSDRMIFQSLAAVFQKGRLFIDKENGFFVATPNLAVLPAAIREFERALALYGRERVGSAFSNFLEEAILITYSFNRVDTARRLYDQLRSTFPDPAEPNAFEAHLYRAFTRDLATIPHKDVVALIEGALFQSYFWQAAGDEERRTGYAGLATVLWNRHADLYNPADLERQQFPSLEQLHERAQQRLLRQLRGDR